MNLIVYYSRTNNTKEISQLIAEEVDGDLLEIKDKKTRSGPVGFVLGAVESFLGKKTDVTYEKKDLSAYDTVYIGTPVWASKPAPAVIKFIEENDFSNVEAVTFATFMGSGGKSTTTEMNNLIKSKGGNIKRSFAFRMTGTDKKELVKSAFEN